MATVKKKATKKIAFVNKPSKKVAVKKSLVKKKAAPKKAISKTVSKTAKKVAVKKKVISKTAKETVSKKQVPVNTVVKKETVKVISPDLIAKGKASKERSAEETAKNKIKAGMVKPEVIVTTDAEPKAPVINASYEPIPASTNTILPTLSPEQQDLKSNRNDGYHSKIQQGNKTKGGIKPSGKKPLW
jgi:hypothetical protein